MITTFTQLEEETQTILKKVVESFTESQKILRSSLGEGVEKPGTKNHTPQEIQRS